MDYLRGYRTFRSDPEWTSKMFTTVGLTLCSMFIPILPGLVVQGWAAMVLRRSIHGIETPLPRLDFDFDYMKKLLEPGFKAFLVRMLWTLPVSFLFSFMFMCVYFGGILAVGGGVRAGGDAGGFVGFACLALGMLLMFPVLVAMGTPATVAAMRAELTDDMNEGMKFGEVIAMTKLMFRELFVGSLLIGFIQFSLSIVAILCCYFPVFFVMWLGIYVHATFQAEIYRGYLAKGGTPLSKIAPPEIAMTRAPQPPQPPQQLPPQAAGW